MKDKFIELQDKYPNLLSCMIFTKLIKGRKMSRPEINKWFTRLVDSTDYEKREKRELLSWMFNFSNGLK